MLLPVDLQKVYSIRKITVQLLLRRLRMLGRLLMLNITVLVHILMHTVRILIEVGLSKGFKGCGSQIAERIYDAYLTYTLLHQRICIDTHHILSSPLNRGDI
jgi:hypothetical protein